MPQHPVIQLYPLPSVEVPLKGLYLKQDLRSVVETGAHPFVYANFITSLDGRIAVPHPEKARLTIPTVIANDRDWRLFQELAVQADILLTSGRYLRDYAEQRAQEILRIYDNPQLSDLKTWRQERGLPSYPDLAVISGSLDFPIPPALIEGNRRVLVVTDKQAPPERASALSAQVGEVIVAGEKGVSGKRLVESLVERGYRLIYSATGPKVLHLLLAGGVLDRLYLTQTHRLLGGSHYASIVEGDLFPAPMDLRLRTVYYDPRSPEGAGQLITSYERVWT